jgi:hypothetical protein
MPEGLHENYADATDLPFFWSTDARRALTHTPTLNRFGVKLARNIVLQNTN